MRKSRTFTFVVNPALISAYIDNVNARYNAGKLNSKSVSRQIVELIMKDMENNPVV